MTEPIETQAIAIRPAMSVGQALGVDEILAQVKLIQDVMHKVMSEGEHFGSIPGCGDKKTLLQPGAQKLTMTFRLAPEYQIQEVNLERGHKEYRVTCTLKSIQSGTFVGQGVGCCSTMESKYRWRQGSRHCPECGKDTIRKSKKQNEGWYCWAKIGGCGVVFNNPDAVKAIEDQDTGRVENDNPADCYNTVLKMAKKRAFVDATITATAASDIFTQDVGDDESETPVPDAKPVIEKVEAGRQPSVGRTAGATPATGATKYATEETRKWMISRLESCRVEATEFFQKAGMLLPTEALEDLPLRFVPIDKDQMQLLMNAIGRFAQGEEAGQPFPANPEKPIEVPREKQVDLPTSGEEWREFPMPWGKEAGTPLGELEKPYLFGLWANYEVEEEYNGKPKKPETIAKDRKFREMLDMAGEHYNFEKK